MDPQHTAIARLFVLLFLIINQTSSRSDGPRYRLRSRRSKQALMLLCWPLPFVGLVEEQPMTPEEREVHEKMEAMKRRKGGRL